MPAENSAVRPATFASLGVPSSLVAVLDNGGITTPFPIQTATLPDALAGRHILGRAKTGSGKTLGYALPLIARIAGGRTVAGRPRGLVLVPTRELATQVHGVLKPLAKAMGLWVTTIYGGVSQGPQVNALRRRTDIVVATPGRLADLIGQGHCDLADVEITVIDEADQMADLGFLPVVRRLLEATPSDGQRLLFSATLDSAIDVLARRFLTDPAQHSVDDNSSPAEIEHHVITVDPADRVEVIAALAGGDKRSLVFTRTKHGAERLARQLTTAGIPAAELHGNLRQGARSRNLAAFGSGTVRVMVATDIAARGIHVDGVELVIHADPPAEHKAYVHRSGRTARAGADGVVVTMQTKAQARDVRNLMQKAGVTPQAATAKPDSAVLREIAGPPAPRVTLLKTAVGLVNPEDRLSDRPDAGQPGAGRPGSGKPQRKPRADGTGRPARQFGDAERSDRGDRFDRPARRSGDDNRFDRRDSSEPPTGDDNRYGQRDRSERSFERPARRSDDRTPDSRRDPSSRRPDRGQSFDRRKRFDRGQQFDRGQSSDHDERLDRSQRFDHGERFDRSQRFDRGERFDRPERPVRGERAWDGRERAASDRRGWGDGRGARAGRGDSQWAPAGRPGPRERGEPAPAGRPGPRERGEPAPAGRPGPRERGEPAPAGRPGPRERGDWWPASRPGRGERGAGSRSWRGDGVAAERGGRWSGATGRSGYAGNRSATSRRQNPGQGRHS
jgi:superfamily II DNA/RNA helicase